MNQEISMLIARVKQILDEINKTGKEKYIPECELESFCREKSNLYAEKIVELWLNRKHLNENE